MEAPETGAIWVTPVKPTGEAQPGDGKTQRIKALAANTPRCGNPFPLMPSAALKSHPKYLQAILQTKRNGVF
ncbi:hypothetical protein [Echinicola sediminis]